MRVVCRSSKTSNGGWHRDVARAGTPRHVPRQPHRRDARHRRDPERAEARLRAQRAARPSRRGWHAAGPLGSDGRSLHALGRHGDACIRRLLVRAPIVLLRQAERGGDRRLRASGKHALMNVELNSTALSTPSRLGRRSAQRTFWIVYGLLEVPFQGFQGAPLLLDFVRGPKTEFPKNRDRGTPALDRVLQQKCGDEPWQNEPAPIVPGCQYNSRERQSRCVRLYCAFDVPLLIKLLQSLWNLVFVFPKVPYRGQDPGVDALVCVGRGVGRDATSSARHDMFSQTIAKRTRLRCYLFKSLSDPTVARVGPQPFAYHVRSAIYRTLPAIAATCRPTILRCQVRARLPIRKHACSEVLRQRR
jgi:hypothetical protein